MTDAAPSLPTPSSVAVPPTTPIAASAASGDSASNGSSSSTSNSSDSTTLDIKIESPSVPTPNSDAPVINVDTDTPAVEQAEETGGVVMLDASGSVVEGMVLPPSSDEESSKTKQEEVADKGLDSPLVVPPTPTPEVADVSTPTEPITPDPTSAVSAPDTSDVVSSGTPPVNTPPVVPPPPSLGNSNRSLLQILVSNNEMSQEQADEVELTHIREGKTVEALLDEKKTVSEEALTKAKAEFYSIPFISLEEVGISPEALTQLPEGVARKYGMLPFVLNKTDRKLSVAMANPLDLLAIDFAEQKSGLNIMAYFAVPSELERVIAERYAQSLSSEVTQALKESGDASTERKKIQDLSTLSGEVIKQAPITKIVETILAFAIKARASDVHIEPQLNRTRVRYRIDGLLTEKLILPSSVHEAVVSRIKILSDLKIDEKRVPQDGRFTFFSSEEEVDLRVSTLPTIHGEKIVMRLLKKNALVPTLTELGLSGIALRKLEDASKVPHGIVLVTGPTGSGKTTTLYSLLHTINTPKVNIMTLEDPVEYQMPGINQVQINPQAGLTFASGLRSFLRQDPNIIMVGEIRDSETVELAIQASLTGHLVFSTLHTSSAAGALPRLMDMGAEPFLLASSMTLTMAQRIARCLNPAYKEEFKPEKPVIDDIKAVLGDRYDAWCKQNNKDPENPVLYRAVQERPQTEPEYKGRIGIFEVMTITEEIAKLILERKSASDIEKVAVKDGMLLMKQDGYIKALEGLTTIEEVLRVAQV